MPPTTMSKPKRILYFINDLFGGGAQNGLINLLNAGFFNGTELHVAAIIRGDGCVEAELLKHIPASRLHIFSGSERMKLPHLLRAMRLYPRLLLSLRPQITILSLPQANLVGRFWGHLLPITRLFVFEHSTAYAKKAYAYLLKALSLSVYGILTDTNRTTTETTRHFLPLRSYKVVEIPLFTGQVNPAYLKTTTKIGKTPRLLIAGRLSHAKNHAGLFHALQILKGQGVPFHLSIAGNGELEPELKALASQLDIAENLTFLGYLSPWTAQCPLADIYLQPSFREGLCLTVVEAMSHGLPVIASSRGGMLDYGHDGENIVFADPDSPPDLAAKIASVIADDKLRSRLSKNAMSSMEARFSLKALNARLAEARMEVGF